jgi:hypothetical protein
MANPTDDLQDMEFAPTNRAIWLLADFEDGGTLCYWRTTREKVQGLKGWHPISYWAESLSRQRIKFEPVGWRESLNGAALEAYANAAE